MLIKAGWLVYLLGLVTDVSTTAFLDLEELKTSFYSVQISDAPIPQPPSEDSKKHSFEEDVETLKVASKFGQQYICHYKPTSKIQAEDSKENAADINITDLLEPMRGMCLSKTKDWWSYEFCYGHDITQFHLHSGQKAGNIILLGKYASDQTWLPEDLEKLKKSTVNRYHTQQYVNGSVCDLTGKSRKTEVRFSCVEGEIDHIGAVAELESCSYIIFVYTSKICHHPYLKPPIQAKPSAIECQPLVSQSIYEDYLLSQAEAKQRSQEALNKKLADAQSIESLIEKAVGEPERAEPELGEPMPADSADSSQMGTEALSTRLKKQEKMSMALNRGGDTVAKYKENIRDFVRDQFDEIIEEAKNELEEDGEGSTLQDMTELKDIMSTVLDSKLSELEALEKISGDSAKSSNGKTGPASEEKAGKASESEQPSAIKRDESKPEQSPKPTKIHKREDIKMEIIQPQLEVEMIDIEDITETSEFYDAAKRAKEQAGNDDKTVKTVIAVLRPMQEKGQRIEEIKHNELEQNYGKKWVPLEENQQRDEL